MFTRWKLTWSWVSLYRVNRVIDNFHITVRSSDHKQRLYNFALKLDFETPSWTFGRRSISTPEPTFHLVSGEKSDMRRREELWGREFPTFASYYLARMRRVVVRTCYDRYRTSSQGPSGYFSKWNMPPQASTLDCRVVNQLYRSLDQLFFHTNGYDLKTRSFLDSGIK